VPQPPDGSAASSPESPTTLSARIWGLTTTLPVQIRPLTAQDIQGLQGYQGRVTGARFGFSCIQQDPPTDPGACLNPNGDLSWAQVSWVTADTNTPTAASLWRSHGNCTSNGNDDTKLFDVRDDDPRQLTGSTFVHTAVLDADQLAKLSDPTSRCWKVVLGDSASEPSSIGDEAGGWSVSAIWPGNDADTVTLNPSVAWLTPAGLAVGDPGLTPVKDLDENQTAFVAPIPSASSLSGCWYFTDADPPAVPLCAAPLTEGPISAATTITGRGSIYFRPLVLSPIAGPLVPAEVAAAEPSGLVFGPMVCNNNTTGCTGDP
jgi:hypothetical protein